MLVVFESFQKFKTVKRKSENEKSCYRSGKENSGGSI